MGVKSNLVEYPDDYKTPYGTKIKGKQHNHCMILSDTYQYRKEDIRMLGANVCMMV